MVQTWIWVCVHCDLDRGDMILYLQWYRISFVEPCYFFFSSTPNEQSKQKVRQLGRITCVVNNTSNEVKCPLLWEFEFLTFIREF